MSMFCFQCQETCRNQACTQYGMCGKSTTCANLMDVLLYAVRGLALAIYTSGSPVSPAAAGMVRKALFSTMTNTNFDELVLESLIRETLCLRNEILHDYDEKFAGTQNDIFLWNSSDRTEFQKKSALLRLRNSRNPDVRSLRELLTCGLKGLCAYLWHAGRLGFENQEADEFVIRALAQTADPRECTVNALLPLIQECGKTALAAMQLLNDANVHHFGSPQPSLVRNTVGNRPGILVSGHDLLDLEDLLIQSANLGIDIYTHGEMLPAHAYPGLKKFHHLTANYGNSWHRQKKEFERFNGPILVTSNCLVPPASSCKKRLFTTGICGWPGIRHIPEPPLGQMKDFSEIIRLAKRLPPPAPLTKSNADWPEPPSFTIGFGCGFMRKIAEETAAGLKSGEISKIVVMAGCDGRSPARKIYREIAENLDKNTLILTAGCAKYRFAKLNFDAIGDLPRCMDAGQCNDVWTIGVFLMTLCEKMGVKDINQLPVSFEIAWFEQKSAAILLGLLVLGVKNISLGPTFPAFFSENIVKYFHENFGLRKVEKRKEENRYFMSQNRQNSESNEIVS